MTDWEQHYQNGCTPWEKGEAAPGLVQYLHRSSLSGRILAPGCGTGHDVRAIASASPDAEVVGLDIAPSAIDSANAIPRTGNESFIEGDLFDLSAELIGSFDWIWEHTCFCAINPEMRDAYVEAVHGALKPGGQFLGVFYLDPYDDEHRREDNRPPFGCTVEELESRFGPSFEIVESWLPNVAYPGREGLEWMMLMRPKRIG